jgi:hypothetical protein
MVTRTVSALALAVAVAACAPAPKKEVAQPVAPPPPAPEHVATDEREMSVQGDLGTIDQDELETVVSPHTGDVNTCFQQGQGRFRFLSGKVSFRARVLRDGSIKTFVPLSSTGNAETDRCIFRVVRALRYPSPKGAAEAEFEYAWQFRPKAPLKEWPAEQVEEAFQSRQADLAACAGRAKVELPAGLRVTFYVMPGGKVGSVGLSADGALDDKLADCVAARVATWRFKDPLGTVARATYQY